MTSERTIAFALGGLAGNNAFGAGFLQAALAKDVQPVMISCTSGQIFWVAQYLQQHKAHAHTLRDVLAAEIEKVSTTHNINLDLAIVGMWGRPGVFRPAYTEYAGDLFQNSLQFWRNIIRNGGNTFWLQELLQTLPGRVLVPLFSDEFFQKISDVLNYSDIGIAFNSYNPVDGYEYVHLNKAARELLTHKSKRKSAYDKGQESRHRDRTYYDEITPETVRDGLWIYQYGFDQKHGSFLDGAYYRQIMLAELVYATDIFVVRPINHSWIGKLPTSYIGIEDLKTEVTFNGSYAGERHQINLINALLEGGDLSKERYHKIDIHEVELQIQRGYLDYVFESLDVFDEAFATGCGALAEVARTAYVHEA